MASVACTVDAGTGGEAGPEDGGDGGPEDAAAGDASDGD
jgi:hypothetical protein